MTRPDLKIIAESLLYLNRLFTIEEREKCRETAKNLVDFIEYLRLIVSLNEISSLNQINLFQFDEMKSFCSPYILLRSIIDQSIHMNMKEAIRIVLKRNQLYDLHIPQIMETFFLDNQNEFNENDDELCFVESLKQEAYDDKITFDNDEIFNNVNRISFFDNEHVD
jgi:hypothetical protein